MYQSILYMRYILLYSSGKTQNKILFCFNKTLFFLLNRKKILVSWYFPNHSGIVWGIFSKNKKKWYLGQNSPYPPLKVTPLHSVMESFPNKIFSICVRRNSKNNKLTDHFLNWYTFTLCNNTQHKHSVEIIALFKVPFCKTNNRDSRIASSPISQGFFFEEVHVTWFWLPH